jgi:hypothetical protein
LLGNTGTGEGGGGGINLIGTNFTTIAGATAGAFNRNPVKGASMKVDDAGIIESGT